MVNMHVQSPHGLAEVFGAKSTQFIDTLSFGVRLPQ